MQKNNIILTKLKEYPAVFKFNDKEITEFFFIQESGINLNDIYVGRVSNVRKDLKACFVNITREITGYLPFNEILDNKNLKQGDEIIVQILKAPTKTKPCTLTMNITIPGAYSVVCLSESDKDIHISSKLDKKTAKAFNDSLRGFNKDYGFIIRTNAVNTDIASVKEELNENFLLLEDIKKGIFKSAYTKLYEAKPLYIDRILGIDKNSYSEIITDSEKIYNEVKKYTDIVLYKDESMPLKVLYGLNKAYDDATNKLIYLKTGGSIVIEPTEALTVIDVNSGKTDKKADKSDLIHITNTEAAKEISRQIKLRNLSGIIIVDFINDPDNKHIDEIKDILKASFKEDSIKTNLLDVTKLGLFEITRQKKYPTIYDEINQLTIDN